MKSIRVKSIYAVGKNKVVFKFNEGVEHATIKEIKEKTEELNCTYTHSREKGGDIKFMTRYNLDINTIKQTTHTEYKDNKITFHEHHLSMAKSLGLEPEAEHILFTKHALFNGDTTLNSIHPAFWDWWAQGLFEFHTGNLNEILKKHGEAPELGTIVSILKHICIHYALTTDIEMLIKEGAYEIIRNAEEEINVKWNIKTNDIIITGTDKDLIRLYKKFKPKYGNKVELGKNNKNKNYMQIKDYIII